MNNNLVGEVDKNYGLVYHTYLQFEDFSCQDQGLETYQDGRQVRCRHSAVAVQQALQYVAF